MDELTNGLQGGLSVCFQLYAKANNPMALPAECGVEGCHWIHDYVRKHNKRPEMKEVP